MAHITTRRYVLTLAIFSAMGVAISPGSTVIPIEVPVEAAVSSRTSCFFSSREVVIGFKKSSEEKWAARRVNEMIAPTTQRMTIPIITFWSNPKCLSFIDGLSLMVFPSIA